MFFGNSRVLFFVSHGFRHVVFGSSKVLHTLSFQIKLPAHKTITFSVGMTRAGVVSTWLFFPVSSFLKANSSNLFPWSRKFFLNLGSMKRSLEVREAGVEWSRTQGVSKISDHSS